MKFKNINIKGMNRGTAVTLILVALAIINMILNALGKPVIAFNDETVTMVVNSAIDLIIFAYGAWKNNSVTIEAQIADDVLEALRDGSISIDDVVNLIGKVTE